MRDEASSSPLHPEHFDGEQPGDIEGGRANNSTASHMPITKALGFRRDSEQRGWHAIEKAREDFRPSHRVDKRTREDTWIKKSGASRAKYTAGLLSIVLFWPVWMKLITLRYEEPNVAYNIHNSSVGIYLSAPALKADATPSECSVCDASGNIAYDVTVNVTHYEHPKGVTSVSYIQLFASFDTKKPENWYAVSTSKILAGLTKGFNTIDVCGGDDDFYDDDDNDDNSVALNSTSVDDDAPTNKPTPAPAPTYSVESKSCCMGSAGAMYLVACIVESYPDNYDLFDKVTIKSKTLFNDICVAVDGVCGKSCGFASNNPQYCEYDEKGRGTIPAELLIATDDDDEDTSEDDDFENDRYAVVYTDQFRTHDSVYQRLVDSFHVLFISFMTITVISMWISFLPGVGIDPTPPPPTIQNLEEYMNIPREKVTRDSAVLEDRAAEASEEAKRSGGDGNNGGDAAKGDDADGVAADHPLVNVAFSISASEPRMMVLRNLVGKLMAWCKEHKIFLKEKPWNRRKVDDLHPQKIPLDDVIFMDVFQDEGNRVGCYALWDAFSDLVNGTDLKFVEVLADEMRDMAAADKILKSNKMPKEKYIATEWSAEKTGDYIAGKLKGQGIDDKMIEALRDAKFDGKFIMSFEVLTSAENKWASLDKVVDSIVSPETLSDLQKLRMHEVVNGICEDINNYNEAAKESLLEDEILSEAIEGTALKCGCKKEHIEQFKMAWKCYDLLTLLGDQRYWDKNAFEKADMIQVDKMRASRSNPKDGDKSSLLENDMDDFKSIIRDEVQQSMVRKLFEEEKSKNHELVDNESAREQWMDAFLDDRLKDAYVDLSIKLADLKRKFPDGAVKQYKVAEGIAIDEYRSRGKAWQSNLDAVVADKFEGGNNGRPARVKMGTLLKWSKNVKKKDPFDFEVMRKVFGKDAQNATVSAWWRLYRRYGFRKWTKNFDFESDKPIIFQFYERDDDLQQPVSGRSGPAESLPVLESWEVKSNGTVSGALFNGAANLDLPENINGAKIVEDDDQGKPLPQVQQELQKVKLWLQRKSSSKGFKAGQELTAHMQSGKKLKFILGHRKIDEDSMMRLHSMYIARAKPKEYLSAKSRGIVPGVIVRLRHPFEENGEKAYQIDCNQPGMTARQYSRLCYGRVKRVKVGGGKKGLNIGCLNELVRAGTHVELMDCSTLMIAEIKHNAQNGPPSTAEDDDTDLMLESDEYEFRVPIDKVVPLCPSRGKSGGMNHTMDVLDEYLVKNVPALRKGKGTLLFAVFDCRHMGQQGFWDGVIPHFFKYDKKAQGSSALKSSLTINENVCFVQLPQTFAALNLPEDFFDMRNEYGFRMSNTVRSGVGAVTSCGTNAVWNIELLGQTYQRRGHNIIPKRSARGVADELSTELSKRRVLSYRFNTETMIEDTASSHEAVLVGRKSVYHFQRDVLGARKVAADYLAAVFRWSQGAVQLFCTAYLNCPKFPCFQKNSLEWAPSGEKKRHCFEKYIYEPIRDAWWPWIMLFSYVAPIVIMVANLQMVDVNQEIPIDWSGRKWCNGLFAPNPSLYDDVTADSRCHRVNFAVLSLLYNYWFFAYVFWMLLIAILAVNSRIVATFSILLENTTYFFNAMSAFFWVFLPCYMSITGTIPFRYDAAMLTFGGLWLEVCTWVLLVEIKSWAPPDPKGSVAPPDIALMRAQQMYFIVAPLHIYAIITGCKSGFGVRFLDRDNSAWNSFQNTTSLTIAKVWVLTLMLGLSVSVIWAIVNLIFYDGFKIELIIGFSTASLILSLIYEPVLAIFYNKEMTANKLRTHDKSLWVTITRAICGKHVLITPKHIYVIFWGTLFGVAVYTNPDGVFHQRWWPRKL